jgi:hypothetical protein
MMMHLAAGPSVADADVKQAQALFAVGDLVDTERRTYPGMNRPAGVALVEKDNGGKKEGTNERQ